MAEPTGNQGVLAALKHPLRRRILRAMSDRKTTSPRELSDALGESLSNVSYHVRILAQNGVIKETRRGQVRGATQHFYRWALKAKWAQEVLRETADEPSSAKPEASKRRRGQAKKPPGQKH